MRGEVVIGSVEVRGHSFSVQYVGNLDASIYSAAAEDTQGIHPKWPPSPRKQRLASPALFHPAWPVNGVQIIRSAFSNLPKERQWFYCGTFGLHTEPRCGPYSTMHRVFAVKRQHETAHTM